MRIDCAANLMKINYRLRLQRLLQNSLFVVLWLALVLLVGALALKYHSAWDITQSNRNLLTTGSVNILKQMKSPIHITVFASKDNASSGDNFRQGIIHFVARYQREKSDIYLNFINPSEEPQIAQSQGVTKDGEVVVEYQKRSEHINPPFAEQEMTNLLVRLARTHQRAVMYLDGHDERSLIGKRTTDIGAFGMQLEKKGFKFANPNLVALPGVPLSGSMLVIGAPKKTVSVIEAQKIKIYLQAGGNLLWLLDDNNFHGLNELADYLGLQVSAGTVVDPNSVPYGGDARLAFASRYGEHAITNKFMLRTSFLDAHQVLAHDSFENGWKVSQLVEVAPNGWLGVTAPSKATPNFNPKTDKRGPINIGIALERIYGKKGQRVVVMGNANFLSDTFITSSANLDLGINIVNWLSGDDNLISIQPAPLKDVNVTVPSDRLNFLLAWFIFHAFQWFIPVGLLVCGFLLWWVRKKA